MDWGSSSHIVYLIATYGLLAVGIIIALESMGLPLPGGWAPSVRGAVAWDLAAAMYLVLAFRLMQTCQGKALRAQAARQDDSRTVILVIILMAIAASFVAIAALAVPWLRQPMEGAAERIAQIEPARTPWLISKGVDDLDHGLQGAPVQLVYVIHLNGEVRHLRADPPSLAKLNCSRADASSSCGLPASVRTADAVAGLR